MRAIFRSTEMLKGILHSYMAHTKKNYHYSILNSHLS